MPQNISYQALCPDIYFLNTKTHVVSIFIANKSNKKKLYGTGRLMNEPLKCKKNFANDNILKEANIIYGRILICLSRF